MGRAIDPARLAAFRLSLPSPRALLLGVAAVLGLALLATGGWLWYARQQQEGVTAFAEAMAAVQAAQGAQAAPEARAAAIGQLEATLQRFPSAPTAAQAAYQLGNLRYAAGEYAAARGAYGVALAKGATDTIRALARAGIGYAWEAERNFDKAAEGYQEALASLGPKDFLYEELMIALGRVRELAGKKPEAIATYQKLLKERPDARRADEVRSRLATLGARPS